MSDVVELVQRSLLIGVGGTAVMDLWLLVLKQFGVPALNFALLGRWIGHMFGGVLFHSSMTDAAPVKNELMIGWISHYAIGIGYAALLVAIFGLSWTHNPTVTPAVLTGFVTVLAPLLVMQPAMGMGVASSKTATPLRNTVRSAINHTVFGFGLFLAAFVSQRWS